ncbi:MAG: bifunctional diaminohydroxyphosphoribosylaminopyrimidine deaminase/5-amino-6-(5-phosphoribosylamino)uracil reductase RibD [Aureibaculum sp.]|nr:bifunctional diaminohydroxyphosphoribosylaminopyrimidine deaminase/5-amino-6-(5-phosphoribosylamino)uracil reductase RibD [Aureibaculum sp.]
MKIHENYINRCIQLAKNGLGNTYPNPLVGCVIVHQDKIIGEGWHQKAGGHHAEVNAINSVKDKSLLDKATLYVSLEPCNHFGKTPPCSDLIISHQIPTLIIGTIDPYDKVAGKGVEKLKKHDCEVVVGVLEKECVELNKRFLNYHTNKRPYIILKWAETKDGFIDIDRQVINGEEAKPNWITNQYSRQLVHKWRTEEQAIMIGTNTAVNDNPKLDVRTWLGKNPIRIVIDKNLRIPDNYRIFDGNVKTIIITEKAKDLEVNNLFFEQIDFSKNVAKQICKVLYKHEIQSVIIEGGSQMLQTFIDADLWDEARIFIGEVAFSNGIHAPNIKGVESDSKMIRSDVLKVLYKRS